MNDVLLNRKKIYKYLGEYEKVHRDRAYTTEEIAKLLHFCDQRLKAIVLFLASSGSRLGSLPTLRVGNLVPISEYKLYKITIYESSREEYYTFCTPEARRAIDEYLQFRERCGEKLGPDSPLFREQFDVNDKENSVNKPRPITSYGIQTTLTNALIKAGLRVRVTQQSEDNDHKNTGRVRKEVARFHGFRKYCVTNMKNASLDFSDREYLVGHRKSRGLDVNYDRTSESQRLEQYLKAVDLLTIDDSHRLRLKVDSLEKKNSEIERLKRRISESEQSNQEMVREFKDKVDTIQKGLTERGIVLNSLLKNPDPKEIMEIIVKEIIRNRPTTKLITDESQVEQNQKLLENQDLEAANANWLQKQVNRVLEDMEWNKMK
jgi:integrase